MTLGEHAHHRLPAQNQLLEGGLLERRTHEAHVDVPLEQLLDVEHRVADAQLELDVGISRAVLGDDRAGDAPRQRAGQAEAQAASLASAGRPRHVSGLVRARQQLARLGEKRLTGGGERGAPAVALKELDPQLRLERADLLADARLRQVEALGRTAEVELLGDGDER